MTRESTGRLTYEHTNCLLIVAHPGDETLWAGGTILMHPDNNWTVVTLCRGSDPDRTPQLTKTLEQFAAKGVTGDQDCGKSQAALRTIDVEDAIIKLLPSDRYDLVITHGLWGEHTGDKRHEEIAKAVMALRESGRFLAREVWMFAYEDGGQKHLPRPIADADVFFRLPPDVWETKYRIITETYGFAPDSFEAKTTPKEEAFWVLGK